MTRRQRRALQHALRRAEKDATGALDHEEIKEAETPASPLPPESLKGQQAVAQGKSQPWTTQLRPLKRKGRRVLAIAVVGFGVIASGVGIYTSRPLISMATSTRDDACSFACSHFIVTDTSPFSLQNITVRCFPQKLVYSDEFALVMNGLDTINPTVKDLESGESTIVRCGYMLRHFMQPGLLLLSHGDPLDEQTKIIRMPVNDKGEPILDATGKIVSLPAMRGGRSIELGQELPLTQADIIFDVTFMCRLVPFHLFHLRRRFELLPESGKLDWEPVPLANPPFTVRRTKPGFELQMAGSIDALESLPIGN